MSVGTPLSPGATRVLLLGSGELGREVAIELIRLGVEVVACDRYADAPAMQVAHRSHVLDMLDPAAVRRVVEAEQPTVIVPEIEAIATSELVALEAEGHRVAPSARAVSLTMNREGSGASRRRNWACPPASTGSQRTVRSSRCRLPTSASPASSNRS